MYTFIGVKEIALSLGFADAGYFSRFFSKRRRCNAMREDIAGDRGCRRPDLPLWDMDTRHYDYVIVSACCAP